MLALAELAKIFNVPTVLTTSAETGESEFVVPSACSLPHPRLYSSRTHLPSPASCSVSSILTVRRARYRAERLPQEITAMHPNASFLRPNCDVNGWDNAHFRKALKATGQQ